MSTCLYSVLLACEPAIEFPRPHRLAAAGRLLRGPLLLWTRQLWPAGPGRTALRPGRARDARTPGLGRPDPGWPDLAREASLVLLASDAGLCCVRRERLVRAPAGRPERHPARARRLPLPPILAPRV